jgi:hypothetical protein
MIQQRNHTLAQRLRSSLDGAVGAEQSWKRPGLPRREELLAGFGLYPQPPALRCRRAWVRFLRDEPIVGTLMAS